ADTASAAAGEITKAQIAPGNGSLNVANNQKKTYTYDLSQLLPALDGGKTYGSVSYQLGAISLGSHYSGGAAISNAMLKLPIEAERGSSVDVGTVNITIASDNFDFTADAVITVKQGAQIPEIEEQPASASYLQGAHNASLKVKAKITDGGKLTYQWYSNAANSNAGGTPISGANGANYKPSTDTVGTMYYYCVVTNTNDKAAGEKTASVVSRAAAVTVLPAVVTHDADITIIGQPNTTYENVHAKMMPLGSTAPLHDRVLQAIANTSPVQYLYHETAADGLYNLVITAEEASSHKTVTLTTLIDLQGHNDRHEARLPEADKSSIVEDNSELGIIAGKVEEVAATQALADPDGHLEVTLTTEQGYDPQTALADAPKIMLQASEDRKEIEVELDIDLLLHQFDANGSEISQINLGSSNVQRLEILIPVKTAGRMPEGFAVYRVHNGQLQKLPYGAGDEYFTVDMRGEFIKLYVKHFSSYAIGYGEPIPQALPTPPKTGDDSQLSLWLMLLAASLMGMSALLLSRKRKIN
ncbi:MAG: LPXTG cell wall anchor domain-containing protein, partial [Clostridia bacterium]|nr:LPXTG cell wall anchor domain-containing protein [Clostridia bacterium]